MQTNRLALDALEATPAARETSSPGAAMMQLVRELYPICRSITGDGVRQTLARLARDIPMQMREVASGTPVLDWDVPREWNIRDAWIKNAAGERVVDFQVHNLHVVNYSAPIRARVSLQDLRRHLHTLPDHPDWIPYRTSYYTEDWGFCVTHRQYEALTEPDYEVCIDAELRAGSLTYGECLLPGQTDAEVLISAHVCHPSLANDNLSGIAVATELARHLAAKRLRYSYRFVFAPGTIGAITWLAQHEQQTSVIAHGLVLAGVGGPGGLTYKRSRRGDAVVDRAMAHVLRQAGKPHAIQDFSPYGHDERQYCSPGFDLPVGCLMRAPWGTYPEYHTSADSVDFLSEASLEESLTTCIALVDVIEGDGAYVNQKPKGEVRLGRYGLYGGMGGGAEAADAQLAMLWVLNLSDSRHTLLDIAERANMPFATIRRAADALHTARLLSDRPAMEGPRDALATAITSTRGELMRVLVTGHNGYIGSVMVDVLVRAGHDVVGLDTYLFEDCTLGAERAQVPAVRADIRDLDVSSLSGFDAVIHLAALSNDPLGNLNPQITYDINHLASVRLARLAREAGVKRFLFASSCSLYGLAASDDLLTEEAAFNPITPYGESKVLVERDVSQLADDRFSPVFLRNATAYGVSPRLRADVVVNSLVGYAFTTGEILIQSDGSPWRPLVHVEDISRAFLAALEAPRNLIHNRAFNVGRTQENYQIRDIAEMVLEVVPGSRVTYAPGGGPDPRCYRVNCDELAWTLSSFQPRWTVRDGVRELYEAYRREGLTYESFVGAGSRYLRIKHLQRLQASGLLDDQLRWTPEGAGSSVGDRIADARRRGAA